MNPFDHSVGTRNAISSPVPEGTHMFQFDGGMENDVQKFGVSEFS